MEARLLFGSHRQPSLVSTSPRVRRPPHHNHHCSPSSPHHNHHCSPFVVHEVTEGCERRLVILGTQSTQRFVLNLSSPGGFVLAGGLIGYIFSKNAASLTTNVLFGGGLLALSTASLKVWGIGKGTSYLPFILGQAGLAAALCWMNFKTYSLTKQLIPSGLYASFSAAMLCFCSCVLISGGNQPPKKLKAGANNASY